MSVYGELLGKAVEAGVRGASRMIALIVALFFIALGLAGAVTYLLISR